MKCKLVQIFPQEKKVFYPEEGITRIGRSGENEIQLLSEDVSRTHAKLENAEGKCVLKDMNSANGTIVNDKKIHEIGLQHGNEIKIGPFVLRFELLDPSESGIGEFMPRDQTTRSMHMTVCKKKPLFPFLKK